MFRSIEGKLKYIQTKEYTDKQGEVKEEKNLILIGEGEKQSIRLPADYDIKESGLKEGKDYRVPVKVYLKYGISQKTNKPYAFNNHSLDTDELIVEA